MIRMVQTYVDITLSYGAQHASMEVVKTIGSVLLGIGTFVKVMVFGFTKNPLIRLTMMYVLFNVVVNASYSVQQSIDQNTWLWMVRDNYQSFGIIFFFFLSHTMMGTAMLRGWGFVLPSRVKKFISCLGLFAVVLAGISYIITTFIDHYKLKWTVVDNTRMVQILSALCIGRIGYNAYHKKPKTE